MSKTPFMGKIYLIGGHMKNLYYELRNENNALDVCYKIDLGNMAMLHIKNMTRPRAFAASAVFEGNIFVAGGMTNGDVVLKPPKSTTK